MNGYTARPRHNGHRPPAGPPPRRHPSLPPLKKPEEMLERGTVDWFDRSRGYGFLRRAGAEKGEIFIHSSVVAQYGLTDRQLEPGTPIRFWIDASRGRGPAAGAIALA